MIIALDFDDTYTRDPELFRRFVIEARSRHHKVYVVTMRYAKTSEEDEVRAELGHLVDGIYCTNRQLKKLFMFKQNINVHVWIDDNPNAIVGAD